MSRPLIAEIEAIRVGVCLFDAKVKALGEYETHHVEEEETELFPACKDAKMDLKELGEQLAMRKQESIATRSRWRMLLL